jgi:regulatory LuxR family protein
MRWRCSATSVSVARCDRAAQVIGADLFLEETTIKTHVSSVLAKLGVSSRVQAVIAAYETGLVNPGLRPPQEVRPPGPA